MSVVEKLLASRTPVLLEALSIAKVSVAVSTVMCFAAGRVLYPTSDIAIGYKTRLAGTRMLRVNVVGVTSRCIRVGLKPDLQGGSECRFCREQKSADQ